jgi:hypothetical protein
LGTVRSRFGLDTQYVQQARYLGEIFLDSGPHFLPAQPRCRMHDRKNMAPVDLPQATSRPADALAWYKSRRGKSAQRHYKYGVEQFYLAV